MLITSLPVPACALEMPSIQSGFFFLASDGLPGQLGNDEDEWRRPRSAHFIVGMTNSAPSLVPDGQRDVTVFVLV